MPVSLPKLNPKGVFLFVDDDSDEHELLTMAMHDLGLANQIRSCLSGMDALTYLKTTNDAIFVILCDINMPKMDGLELKRAIDLTPEIKLKSIPFLFHSNSATPSEVKVAYSLGIQGYFQKSTTLNGTIEALTNIVNFWTSVVHPNDIMGKL